MGRLRSLLSSSLVRSRVRWYRRVLGDPAALRYWLVDWLALRLADRVLADTGAHRDYYVSVFGIDPGKVAVIPVVSTGSSS